MTVLRVEYLAGRSVSSEYNDPDRAEWPPHPARIFSALVDALYAGDGDPSERDALLWLEAQDPPALTASGAARRDVRPVFVPVNDVGQIPSAIGTSVALLDEAEQALAEATDPKERKRLAREVASLQKRLDRNVASVTGEPGKLTDTMAKEAVKGLVDQRLRQPRTFPSVTPDDPVVHLHWAEAPPDIARALDRVARRVVRVGHSSSLVACRLVEVFPEPNLWPDDDGDRVLRVPRPGQLVALDDLYDRLRASEPRVLPKRDQRYSDAPASERKARPSSVFGEDWIVLRRVAGARLPITRAVDLARATRRDLLDANGPLPAVVTGHDEDGEASRDPHLAVVPLPFVGGPHATGQLLGVALVPPRAMAPEDRQALLAAIAAWILPFENAEDESERAIRVRLGSLEVALERQVHGGAAKSLSPATWCRTARSWVSVTPVALSRNPGNLHSDRTDVRERAVAEAEAAIRRAAVHAGLPEPVEVRVHLAAPIRGAEAATAFPPFPPQPGRTRRVKVHARVRFEEPVRGPVILGAGRFLGLGLFRPEVDDDRA